ncbi:MAG: dihydroxy-acid dehydratase [Ancalomicrobiaceae bacterium]|nr:dihydroxy-acid dehydratase [Ancalomicrobiaceae bacterium]
MDANDRSARGFARGLTNYGDRDFARYLRKSFAKSMGYSDELLDAPIVGICTTPSGFNNCHRGVPELVEAVKRGVLAAGALPLEFPVLSLGEVFLSPTSLKYRNLMAMDVEEMIRAQPMDAVVLIGGCDKTVPAQLMGAVSADLPAVQLVTGPMSTGRYKGERLGACTDCRRFWSRYRAGEIDATEIDAVEGNLAVTAGTCAVMGTASTMACMAEALGIALPGSATIPAVHADRLRVAEATGRLAVRLVGSQLTPAKILTRAAFDNALRVLLALSGSTNAVIHLAAIAGRAGIVLDPAEINRLSDETPVLVNLKPTGDFYMEDLNAAGGISAVMAELEPLLNLDCQTIAGETLGARIARERGRYVDRAIVRTRDAPIDARGGLIALTGTLAPGGAILKRAAATPDLLEHEGRAVVFSSLDDLAQRIDDPRLDVAADDVLVLQNAGPKSASGMPEAGYLPIPKKLARAGVKDMVRISDARMSGTAFGTIVLHVTPEAAVGGPLGLVRNGDRIRLSAAAKRIDLLVAPDELARRAAEPTDVAPYEPARGYAALYREHVMSATDGCDFDFLQAVPHPG